MSWSPELFIGELRQWPDSVHVVRGRSGEVREYTFERTCIPLGVWEPVSQTQDVRHMLCECGHELGMDRHDSLLGVTRYSEMPKYCPECGAKVVDE